MVESIQQVGKVMGLRTIAEHVEDEETLITLQEIGVDFVQGYHLGRPESVLDE
jgi:EAL domain-containing protein (putative c-di-GMP-specific phosphodiesterase class I)